MRPRSLPRGKIIRRERPQDPAGLVPQKAERDLALRGLLGDLILQIIEEAFAGLDSLVHLLGKFIAYEDADGKTENE
jgi:hypothetical protein